MGFIRLVDRFKMRLRAHVCVETSTAAGTTEACVNLGWARMAPRKPCKGSVPASQFGQRRWPACVCAEHNEVKDAIAFCIQNRLHEAMRLLPLRASGPVRSKAACQWPAVRSYGIHVQRIQGSLKQEDWTLPVTIRGYNAKAQACERSSNPLVLRTPRD